MTTVTIYTRLLCPFCFQALSLLKNKKVAIEEIKVNMNTQLKAEMVERANGATTFPQIFVGDTHVGGCDDLIEMDKTGKLDALLSNSGSR